MGSNKIIHFTPKFGYLKNIIKTKELRLAYCEEDFFMNKLRISGAAHPMVCFSKYNIPTINTNLITYGKYGIGFSMEWASRKKINPVLYIDKDSIAALGLGKLLRARRNKEDSNLPENLRLPIMQLKCFTKNVRGYNSYFKQQDFDFESENEWRYVPTKSAIENGLISMGKSTYKKKKDFFNNKLIDFPLKFKASEFEIIFVATIEEKNILIEELGVSANKIRLCGWSTNKIIKKTIKNTIDTSTPK